MATAKQWGRQKGNFNVLSAKMKEQLIRKLTARSRVLQEKVTTQLVKKFLNFTKLCSSVFKTAA
jgi:hypothetical protein